MISKEEGREILEKNKGLAERIQGSFRAMNEFKKIYNSLCQPCQLLVQSKPNADISEYCPECQNKVNWRLKRIEEILEKK